MTTAAGQHRAVAYLVSRYPSLSHAFIETEIDAVRRLGVEVRTFSVRAAAPEELMTERSRDEAAATEVLLGSTGTVVRACAALVRRSPRALVVGLWTALCSGEPTLRARLWQVFYLLEAAVLWSGMTRAGLRHIHVHLANNGADIARLTIALGTAVDGAVAGWRWSMAMHGPTEFEDRTRFDLEAKAASASAIAAITDFCRSQVMRLLDPEAWGKTGVVRMAVDPGRFRPPEAFSPSPSPSPSPDGAARLRVLTVGRLVPEKGAPVLVEAVALARARGLDVRLAVVGAGPLAARLAAQVEEAGIAEAVELVGPLGHEELPDRYRDADVFCLPSFAEGLPVVLMEAMASGLPVVTTAIAGIPELVVDHRTGLVVPAGRADLVADALTELAGDMELRRRLGEAGRAVVLAHHEPAANARLLVDLWDRTAPV